MSESRRCGLGIGIDKFHNVYYRKFENTANSERMIRCLSQVRMIFFLLSRSEWKRLGLRKAGSAEMIKHS